MRPFILADNQYITREGLSGLITHSGLSQCIVSVKTMKELQENLGIYPHSVVILDYALFDFASAHQMLIVKEAARASSWILFSEELSASFLRKVSFADPTISVIMKSASRAEIMEALQNTLNHMVYLCDLSRQILDEKSPLEVSPATLTTAERSILREIALGKTTKEIAREKILSFHTINSHRKNIFRKLEINNVHEAVKYAFRAGLIDITDYYI